ncbi:MerR family transcriptional regulator [Sedimentibacter hydroxybenzoicus DSM 7310]|uniref:MerR family transcriptional regulator n=1 Tax=Sedimentibacter hydroxybenzoicus DSM 7310 TaxID=1123245 RepID=A0A974BGS9_SEDHY|nr:MerR family transcriptional regulator [Sedimentibacter hydroxybenzoicus]NYB72858.1 MerR family transcriptional regulator [Sedimentibacter hydroxybenzoicus DSM 7310]
MMIKEIEKLSGMDRANIRFYESEGLIAPRRMDNGYRDYSEDDLQILLRIKLLRSLHISLDEIMDLKNGSKDLMDTLSNQIIRLEQEKQDVSYAKDMCHAMQEDRVSFADLDAKKYIDGINQAIKATGSTYFSVKGDEYPQVYYPWRRYLARALDIFIYGVIWSAFLAFVFHVNVLERSTPENILDTLIEFIMMLFLEPLWLRLFGTTPGKFIFGLRIENPDGGHLSYTEGLERTLGVIANGMGYNIPIYNIIRLWKSYNLCIEKEVQPWDESVSYTIKDTKWYRGVIYIAASAMMFFVMLIISSAQMLPPNKGDLTVAEFADNYNYYAKLFEIDLGDEYMSETGKWDKKKTDGSVIYIGFAEKPEYHFTTEDGYVTGVSFAIEVVNNESFITSYRHQMFLASLAFAGAQDEIRIFSKIPKRIEDQISNNLFKDYSFEEAGITFICDVEYSGYRGTQSQLLFPSNEDENYFSLKFSMNLLR